VTGVAAASLGALQKAYEQAEERRRTAADAERTAFQSWEQAYGAHEVARDESTEAFAAYRAGLGGR
jgi:hypothetical protein